jgi:hypothetical protein
MEALREKHVLPEFVILLSCLLLVHKRAVSFNDDIIFQLPPIGNRAESVEKYIKKSLNALQLNYVDLYLVHIPIGFQEKGDDNLWPMDENGTVLIDKSTDHISLWKVMNCIEKSIFEKLIFTHLLKFFFHGSCLCCVAMQTCKWVLIVVRTTILFLWGVMPCILKVSIIVLEKHTVSIFSPVPLKWCYPPTGPYDIAIQNTTVDIFTAVRTSALVQ